MSPGACWPDNSCGHGVVQRLQGSNSYDGAPAFQYDCTATYYDQYWRFDYDPAGGIRIKNNLTHRCLAFQGSNRANGAPAVEYQCLDYRDQLWDLHTRFDNAVNNLGYDIVNLYTHMCLAFQGSNKANGAPAFQYDCVDGYHDQVWQLR